MSLGGTTSPALVRRRRDAKLGRSVPLMRFRPIVNLITLGLSLSVLFGGCADPSALVEGGTSGCRQEVLGKAGVIRPETSRLSCTAINEMIDSFPSEPQAYLIQGESPPLLWKCRFYGTEQGSVFLRCENDKRHFSIVKGAS